MLARKAHVKHGHIVLDEPTDLPEGSELHVAVLEDDELDDVERSALHDSIEKAEAELDAGLGISEQALWARLRAHG